MSEATDTMSDLQKSFAKAKLAKLPSDVPVFNELDEEDSSSASSASSTGTIRPSVAQNLFARPNRPSGRAGLESLPWIDFFDRELFLEENRDGVHIKHHVYVTAPSEGGPLFVVHHGAGSSGLSFATVAMEIRRILPKAGILSVDARDHGDTEVTNQDGSPAKPDLNLKTLSDDLISVVNMTRLSMNWDAIPDIVLVGHSLGGSVVTDVAKREAFGSKVLAYAVLDVVEGSALEALQSMEAYLAIRPTSFATLASGIEWHTRSRTIRNTTSARVCVPSLLHETQSDDRRPWHWRTDLHATKPFWENWFTGLSRKFLEARGGKLLLLAGTDRLDKELMIGQMQGKYQLQVFPEAGHFIHEDQPVKTAQILADFYRRNDRSALILPPKVGDILAAQAAEKGIDATRFGESRTEELK